MTHVVVNPSWGVPNSIAIKDKLPKIRNDPAYFSRLGYHVFNHDGAEVDPWSIDWSMVPPGHFPYRLRQNPGEKNALGLIKFLLNDPYDIYLHDTPDHYLFNKASRSFSSGCIRLKDAVTLSDFVLEGDADWTHDRVVQTMGKGGSHTIKIAKEISVYVTYFTVWVDDINIVHFAPDIYKLDPILDKDLELHSAKS
jgi:murein L,D-transpeptidase YcbB/YkuD